MSKSLGKSPDQSPTQSTILIQLLERHLTFGNSLLCGRLSGLCCRLLLAREHLHIVDPNLYHCTAYAILVIIRAAVDATLNIELVALMYILLHGLSQAAPENKIVPLSAFRNLSTIRKCVGTV